TFSAFQSRRSDRQLFTPVAGFASSHHRLQPRLRATAPRRVASRAGLLLDKRDRGPTRRGTGGPCTGCAPSRNRAEPIGVFWGQDKREPVRWTRWNASENI